MKTNIPEIRFPEFSNNIWAEKELGTLGTFIGGGTPDSSKEAYWKGNIPWISSSDIREDSILDIEFTRYITEEAIIESATKKIPENSILIVSRVGIGKFAVSKQELCTSQDFTNFVTTENSYFLAYYFKARAHKFINLSQGTSIKGFTGKDLRGLKFFIPENQAEQQKIANFLTLIDKRIQLLTRKKEALERYKKGMMQKLFNQEIRFKDENGNDFPEWEEKKIKQVLKIGTGRDYKHLSPGNIPVYGTGGHMTSVDDFLYDGESVGIGRKGTIDRPVFLKGKFWTVDTLFYTHSFNHVLPYFAFLLFQAINWQEYNEATGVPSLSKSTIENIKVMLPSILEQRKIVQFSKSMNYSLEIIDKQINNSKLHKRGLLQKMFV